MTVGMWIRNSWIRVGNDSLVNQFQKLGVYHADDISGIILTSLHRKLNAKELKLEEQAQHYIDYCVANFMSIIGFKRCFF